MSRLKNSTIDETTLIIVVSNNSLSDFCDIPTDTATNHTLVQVVCLTNSQTTFTFKLHPFNGAPQDDPKWMFKATSTRADITFLVNGTYMDVNMILFVIAAACSADRGRNLNDEQYTKLDLFEVCLWNS